MFILAVTGIVPESLQRVVVFILFVVLIFGAVLFFVGVAKTYPRSAFPFMIALFLFAFIMVVIYAVLQG